MPKPSRYEIPTFSSSRRSCMILATAFILTHFDFKLIYLRTDSSRVCLCCTIRTDRRNGRLVGKTSGQRVDMPFQRHLQSTTRSIRKGEGGDICETSLRQGPSEISQNAPSAASPVCHHMHPVIASMLERKKKGRRKVECTCQKRDQKKHSRTPIKSGLELKTCIMRDTGSVEGRD